MTKPKIIKDSWGTRVGLIFAMAGFAVGFGNFLRFPVQAIQNGGGAFIIPYLVSFVLIGIPMLLSEWAIGRYGGGFGHHAAPFMLQRLHRNPVWKYVGVFGIFTNIAVAAYYTFLESWTLSYVFHSIKGTFLGLSQYQVVEVFNNYVSLNKDTLIPYEAIVFYMITLALNIYILSRGIKKGIEKVAKYGVPLLIVFGAFLAIKTILIKEGEYDAVNAGTVGLNFLWTPDYSSIFNPKVWLAAAGQIFFTIGVGWGTIQCYASYLNSRSDIALNSMSAGWMNEFVEVVLGASIIIPISIGFLGIERVKELAGLGGLALGFKTMPYLFSQWGPVLSAISGAMWFGLLFIAGITSSLAMGSPYISFMQDEFRWSRNKSAISFGIIIMLLGLPTVFFYNEGVFDQYDYWTGTFALFVFAMLQIILFAWFFGIDKAWKEINIGAEIKIPVVFKYIIGYVTPILLIIVFLASVIKPLDNDWIGAFNNLFAGKGWILDNSSIIKQAYSADLIEQINETTDIDKKEVLEWKKFLSYATKTILMVVFIIFIILVNKTSKKYNFNNINKK